MSMPVRWTWELRRTCLAVELTRMDFVKGVIFKNCIIVHISFLVTWGGLAISNVQSSGENEHLGMPRIGFVTDAMLINAHNAIEDANLMIAVSRLAEIPFDLQFEGLLQTLSIHGETFAWTEGSKVITMYCN